MSLYEFDKQWRENYPIICGVDEAGRGPLAGDVYAAAVILPADCVIEGINDSKKLTAIKRERLYNEIIESAVSYCIAAATVEEIEKYNILGATFLAMRRAVEGLNLKPDLALIDGNQRPELSIKSECVIKGDSISACIAAASILAKVARDRYMKGLGEHYPNYCFEKHKGYGTKLHIELIRKYGACPEHRLSFLRKIGDGANGADS